MSQRWAAVAAAIFIGMGIGSIVSAHAATAAPVAAVAELSEGNPEEWFTAGRDGGGTYFSPLSDINTKNVSELGFAWERKLGTRRGIEATPVIIQGVMYFSGLFGRVYALKAGTGEELWTYDPQIDGQYGRYACCDAVNRGVAVWNGRVYVGSLDGYLHAIDAKTGKRIWKVDTLPARVGSKSPYTLPAVPVIAGNVVVVGSGGADFAGVRGYVAAYDLGSGSFRWRFYTVPRDPSQGAQDQPHLVAALETWDANHEWEKGIGGTVWDGMSYDPKLKLVYFGTANGSPYDIRAAGASGKDELYTAAIVAVHAETGQLAWYYQTTPADHWDYDSTQKLILTDLDFGRGPRPCLMQASKNGFYYVLDRTNGKLIGAKSFAYQNWTTGMDPVTGRPIFSPLAQSGAQAKLVFPSNVGAHSWQPMSYDRQTHLTYIPTIEWAMVYANTTNQRAGLVEGTFTTAGFPAEDYDPKSLHSLYGRLPTIKELDNGQPSKLAEGFLRAWDPVKQKLAWQVKTHSKFDGGVLSTGGGLVFQGDSAGVLKAYSASNGKLLASLPTGTGIMAAPVTYKVGGRQFVAVLAGFGGNMVNFALHPEDAAWKYSNEGRVIAFEIGGEAVPLPPALDIGPFPKPPAREGSAEKVASGEVLYNRFCSRCHELGRGVLPDLRRLSPEKHQIFYGIVLQGLLKGLGMGRWDDVLSREDAEAIHAYIVDEAWKAYSAENHTH